MPDPDRPADDADSVRRAEGIAAYASQFGITEEEVIPFMVGLLGERMAEEAQHSAATTWRDNALSRRDRSLIVIASLITQGGVDARLRGHLRWAPQNGVTLEELDELVALLAVYVGYPKASTGMELLRDELGPMPGESAGDGSRESADASGEGSADAAATVQSPDAAPAQSPDPSE